MSEVDDLDGYWPDEGQQAERRARLENRLAAFLDQGMIPSDGGWAEVEQPHVDELYKIFQEIIDLKVARDADGDQTVQFIIANRRLHRMHAIFESNAPRWDGELSTEDTIIWMDAAARESDYAQAVAKGVAENLTNQIGYLARQIRDNRAYEAKLNEVLNQINTLSFDDAANLIVETQKIRRGDVEPTFSRHHEAMANRFPNELEDAIVKMEGLLASIDSEETPLFQQTILPQRLRMYRIFGKKYSDDPRVDNRSRELRTRGIAERKAMRLARQKA